MRSAMAESAGHVKHLETIFESAWTGIKNSIAVPIMQYVVDHFEQIKGAISSAMATIGGLINQVGPYVTGAAKGMIEFGGAIYDWGVGALKVFGPALSDTWDALKAIGELVKTLLSPILSLLPTDFQKIADAIQQMVYWIKEAVTWFTDLLHSAAEFLNLDLSAADQKAVGLGNPNASGAGGGAAGNTTVKASLNFNVDPKKTADLVHQQVKQPLRDAMDRVRSGVSDRKSEWVETAM